MLRIVLLLLLLSGAASTADSSAGRSANSCPRAKCSIDLINAQERQNDLYRLQCSGCNRPLTWRVTDWLAAKLSSGVVQGEPHTGLPMPMCHVLVLHRAVGILRQTKAFESVEKIFPTMLSQK